MGGKPFGQAAPVCGRHKARPSAADRRILRWLDGVRGARVKPADDDTVAVIVLNLDRRDLLLACLASVKAQSHPAVEIVVVDNGSRDGSPDAAASAFPDVHILRQSRNLGVAGGRNAGFAWASKNLHAPFLLFIDNDTTLDPEAVTALMNLYRCRDGRWFLMSLTADERRWPDLAACIDRPDVLADPRFATIESRRANARALIGILDDVFAKKDWAEWRAILERSGIAFGVVGTLDDIPSDRQMVDGGALVPIDDRRAGARFTVSSPIAIDGQDKVPARMPPGVGEHTIEILREAGFAEAEIERLLRDRVVVQGDRA